MYRKAAWGIALAVPLGTIAILGWATFRRDRVSERTYRIGWQNSPPYQLSNQETPAGMAVDLVDEAARRRGIKLKWIYWLNSSESALRSQSVDLWPLITITPERLKLFHITDPYMEVEYCLIVRKDRLFRKPQDLSTANIGVANVSLEGAMLHRILPAAQARTEPTPSQVLEDVCEQRDDAAFMDVYTAIAALLEERACAGQALHWMAVPELRTRLGVGSTFAARDAADALREEIGAMAREGKLAPIVGKWGLIAGRNLESMDALLGARRREARLAAIAALFALLLVLACWEAVRLTRERNRVRRRDQALRVAEHDLRASNKALAAELEERTRSEQKVHALTARLMNAQEEERARIARELHDDLSQQIAVASIAASNLRKGLPPGSNAVMTQSGRLQEVLVHLAERVRRISHDLHPAVLEHAGIEAALRSYCETLGALTLRSIIFNSAGVCDGVPQPAALCAYRVAQEALQNWIKHAGVKEAEVALRCCDGVLRLTVSDRGAGMDPEAAASSAGLGLVSIKERARLVNGTVEVNSRLGEGVTLTLTIPLQTPELKKGATNRRDR